ncbi:MAG: translocation/assembly module TamB [Thermodesulfobacteriota bacterium]|nr:MAG: translocation/assembly module TamB [Thermodesulfobacteriota bacterium]
MRKKILISISIFFVIIILALVGLMFFTQTQSFRNFTRNQVESIVSSTTGQTFKIGNLEGNFFQNITLSDVSFVVEGENFVSVKEITIDYAFFQMLNSTSLFSKVIPVDDLLITGLDVNLIKYDDGKWNFEKIGGNEEKQADDQDKTPPSWSIILSKFLLTNAEITTDDRAENKVSKYEIPKVDLSIKLIDIYRAIDLDLRNAEFSVPDQNLSISELSTKAYYSDDKVNVDNLSVLFNNAEINLNADAENLQDKPKFSLDASVKNYVIENIGTINLEAEGNGEYVSSNDIRANATIKIPESEILQKKISGTLEEITMSGTTININAGNFNSDLGKIALGGDINLNRIITKEGNNNFDITLNLDDIKTTEIFTLLEAATDSSSTLPVDTQLGAVLNSEINATGSWEEFSDLGVKADIKKFEIKGEQAGDLQLSGIADYTNSTAGIDINLNLEKVNLGSILADLNYSSEITSKFDIQAQIPLQGNLLQNLSADIDGTISPSSIFGINLTDGAVDVSYENQILDIKSLELNADKNKLIASGKSPEKLGADFNYEIEVENLSFISGISPDLELSGNLKASGDITGNLQNPTITIDGEVLNFSLDEKYTAKSINIDGSGRVSTEEPELTAKVSVETLTINKKEIREIQLDVASEGTAINANLNIIEDDQFQYKMEAALLDLSSTQKDIQISELVLKLEDTTLDNRENILLTVGSSGFVLKNFNLYHNDSSALANANISGSKIDGNLKISNLSLDDITKALEFQTPLQGTINANVDIEGTKQKPAINASIQTQDLQYNDFKNDNILFSLNYLNQNLNLNFVISNESTDILTAKGTSKINLNLDDVGKSVENADINLSINSNDLNISPLSSIIDDVVKSEGALDINLTAAGKLKNPKVNGQIGLTEGLIQTKTIRNEIGIPKAVIVMNGQKAILQTLELTTSNGSATFEGEFDIPTLSYTLSGNLDNLLIKPERISAALTGDLKVKGKAEQVDISGKITVEKARITIPDSEPKELPEIQYVDVEKDEFVVDSGNEESYFDKNIALNLRVDMKRNNWVRGQGANVELRGDLDIKKDFDDPIRIIGNIGVIRGTYENFGKVFRIQEGGRVSFSGREEIDPFLDITAQYRVSDINIYINIGGQASAPKITLTSDPAMSETDIVSYLVFGASSTDISSGERSAAGGIASGLAGGIAAAQLERLMGNAVSLDVVSISGTNVEVGKYLTEDLYIAFERGTTDSIIDSTNITYNKVLVEYNIFNNVTIDAELGGENPGADLFYNFNF